jgi:hypothetical protein
VNPKADAICMKVQSGEDEVHPKLAWAQWDAREEMDVSVSRSSARYQNLCELCAFA